MTVSDDDLRDLALACRAMAHQWQMDANRQANPTLKERDLTQARRFRELAERMERERK